MYKKPEVTRFGSFRELTLVGVGNNTSDVLSVNGTHPTYIVNDQDDVGTRLS